MNYCLVWCRESDYTIYKNDPGGSVIWLKGSNNNPVFRGMTIIFPGRKLMFKKNRKSLSVRIALMFVLLTGVFGVSPAHARAAARAPGSLYSALSSRPRGASPAMEEITIARGRRGVRPVRRARTFDPPARRNARGLSREMSIPDPGPARGRGYRLTTCRWTPSPEIPISTTSPGPR
jgi:hypothetical protein